MAGQITGRGNQAQGIVALLLAAAFMNKANESFGGPPQQGPDLNQLFNTGNNDVPFLNDGQGAIPELLEALTGGLDEFPNGNGNNNLFNQSPFGQPPNPFQAMGQGAELMGDLMLMLVMDLLGQGQNQGQLPFGQQQLQQNPLGQLGNLFGSLPNLANGMADFCNPCTGNGFGSYGQQGQAAMTAFMAANENGFMMGAAIAAQMQQGCASPPQVCAPPPQVCAPPPQSCAPPPQVVYSSPAPSQPAPCFGGNPQPCGQPQPCYGGGGPAACNSPCQPMGQQCCDGGFVAGGCIGGQMDCCDGGGYGGGGSCGGGDCGGGQMD
ncbi:MAG: hypothetical protein KC476_08450, partial [Cyanobacteria bacterium HKST-UBA06]|nr:hypothetical protein [Cyanobacteria bacterium HKST-UBA06]